MPRTRASARADPDRLAALRSTGLLGTSGDRLELIFGRFEQVDADDARQRGGAGPGLAIRRAMVARHGGRIRAESMPGAGGTLSFTLPAHRG